MMTMLALGLGDMFLLGATSAVFAVALVALMVTYAIWKGMSGK